MPATHTEDVSRWGAIATGSALTVVGGLLLRAGLTTPAGEHPWIALARLGAEWLLGPALLVGGALVVVVGSSRAVRRRSRPADGLDRDLAEAARWPDPADW